MNNETFKDKYKRIFDLINLTLEKYNLDSCQCAYPRFQQLVGIDCSKSGKSFRCWETEILISSSKKYFEIIESKLKDENVNQTWICKKCKSEYEFGWSDFSIHVDRQKLKLINLKTNLIGKETEKPIPLFLGLFGHSYPKKSEMDFAEFKKLEEYLLEK